MFFSLTAASFLSLPIAFGQTHPVRADLPAQDEIRTFGVVQDSRGSERYLHGSAKIETSDFDLSADEIEYNSDTNWATAHGHVHLEHFATGDKLDADHAEYNIKTQEGRFYVVTGTAPAKVLTGPGILTTPNPFYFQAQWAQRIKDRYILHKAFVTDCKLPKPWWVFEAPVFDVIPGDRAIGRRTIFRIKRVPVFYLPYFYRPLGGYDRASGFLTPNAGHSTLYGWMAGIGYYWAMSRSYDMMGVLHYFSQRGYAPEYDFRGKPNQKTDINFYAYGVRDKGVIPQGSTVLLKEGGLQYDLSVNTELLGFKGVLDYHYVSSFLFRQAFSYAFVSSIWSQNNSIGYLTRHYSDDVYAVNITVQREQNFEAITYPSLHQLPNQIIIDKFPSVEVTGRDQQISDGALPVWFSFGASGGSLSRSEPIIESNGSPAASQIFNTGQIARVDIAPQVSTQFSFKGFSLIPSIALGLTDYSNSYSVNSSAIGFGYGVTTEALGHGNLFRKDADFTADMRVPTLERVFNPPKWMHLGGKIKHVIEAEAIYEDVSGINQFQRIVHFDMTDILSDTNQLTYYLTNRFYRKGKDGNVSEVIRWSLAQARYFDPTFGGAVIPNQGSCAFSSPGVELLNPYCQRVTVLAVDEFTPYTFLDRPRTYSPIASTLVFTPFPLFSIDYRADYDPVRHGFVDHTLGASVHKGGYFAGINETAVTTNPVLIPPQDQIQFGGGYGNSLRKGWNIAGYMFYDKIHSRRLYDFFQTSYNTNCCGFGFELRNFNLGIRQENQYLFAFTIANIGTVGSLPKQMRIF